MLCTISSGRPRASLKRCELPRHEARAAVREGRGHVAPRDLDTALALVGDQRSDRALSAGGALSVRRPAGSAGTGAAFVAAGLGAAAGREGGRRREEKLVGREDEERQGDGEEQAAFFHGDS